MSTLHLKNCFQVARKKHSATTAKRKGALVSESALHFDGDKPNSVSELLRRMIIYLTPLARDARHAYARP